MAANDILEVFAAQYSLASTPRPWFDAARGVISVQEAAQQLEGEEPPELIERSATLFAAGEALADERRLRQLLRKHFGEPRRRWRGPLLVVLGMAAALVLVLPMTMTMNSTAPASSPLDSYTLELDLVARSERGAEPDGDVAKFYADRSLRVTLRPWTAVEGTVEATVYACDEAGSARRLPLEPRVGPDGVVVVEGDVQGLGLGVGTWELVFIVGRAGSLPEPRTCDAEEVTGSKRDARALRTRIEIVPPPR